MYYFLLLQSIKYSVEKIKFEDKNVQTYNFGEGDKVIFSFPSFPHSGLYYILFTKFYDPKKFKFVTLDLPGWAGWSGNIFENEPVEIERYVDLAELILKHYKVDKFSLIGYSFGGALATILASRRPDDVRNLVIVSTIVNGKLLKGSRERRLLFLAKLLGQEKRLKRMVIKRTESFAPIAEENFGEKDFRQYMDMLIQSDERVIFESIDQLFSRDFISNLEKIRSIENILIVNSRNENKMFRVQAEYLRRFFDQEETLKLSGTHDGFILRPKSKVIKQVLDFLVQ
ncbi:alpha/beta fold hydrolase [Candidatus Dojkabacteria bacterium]|nr:alpha/beta fold hydrolase [Candidatus Dojkabacteria bacterium]